MERSRTIPAVLVGILLMACLAATIWLFPLREIDLTTGFYTFDPRTDQASPVILANRPDRLLVQALNRQIARDGSYPPDWGTRVTNVEPIRVAISTFTDWQAQAYITTRIDYEDGSSRTEEFRFHSVASEGAWLPIIGDVTIRAYYDRLGDCKPLNSRESVCRIE